MLKINRTYSKKYFRQKRRKTNPPMQPQERINQVRIVIKQQRKKKNQDTKNQQNVSNQRAPLKSNSVY